MIPTRTPAYEPFACHSGPFQGSVAALIDALRHARITPDEVQLLAIIKQYVAYYQDIAAHNMDIATETLPHLARLIELKMWLLLPKPPKAPDAEEEQLSEGLEVAEILEQLEDAIHFLKGRREARQVIVVAQAPRPQLPRPKRAVRANTTTLAQLASRYQNSSYFELARERLSMPYAMAELQARLAPLGRCTFEMLVPEPWKVRVVYFVGMLELIKNTQLTAHQDTAFSPITLTLAPSSPTETPVAETPV